MELITVIGTVVWLGYIVYKLNVHVREEKKERLEWEIKCMEQYVKAVNYKPSCREVLAYQKAKGR